MKKLALGAALAALVALVFDKQRRKQLPRQAKRLVHRASGAAKHVAHLREQRKPQPNDATLAAKVESEVLGHVETPTGHVNVNAENGVVVLRGQVEGQDVIRELESRVRKVQGVRDVENLLHLPGEEAPMHQAHTS